MQENMIRDLRWLLTKLTNGDMTNLNMIPVVGDDFIKFSFWIPSSLFELNFWMAAGGNSDSDEYD